jgi:hypothetical protein
MSNLPHFVIETRIDCCEDHNADEETMDGGCCCPEQMERFPEGAGTRSKTAIYMKISLEWPLIVPSCEGTISKGPNRETLQSCSFL